MIRDACFPSSWKEAEVVNLSCEGRDEITGRVILDFVKVIWLDHHFRNTCYFCKPLEANLSILYCFLRDFPSLMRVIRECVVNLSLKFCPFGRSVRLYEIHPNMMEYGSM